MEGVEDLTLAAAFTRGQAAYHQCQTGGADEVRERESDKEDGVKEDTRVFLFI